jgi:hypothetical protein
VKSTVRGDVGQPRPQQHIVEHAVAVVRLQRAHVALRVVVLALRKAVVDEQRRAARKPVGQGAHEGQGLRVDFGHGAHGQGVRFGGGGQQGGGAVGKDQIVALLRHAAFHPAAFVSVQ